MAALPCVALHATQRADAAVFVFLHVLRIPDRAIVAGENEKRLIGLLGFVERAKQAAD